MNSFNDEDRDTSNRVHKFVIRMVANNMKCDFMAGSYACAWDDEKSAKLNGFPGSKILESKLLIAVANGTAKPTPGLLSQEVSHFFDERHIGTRMMQSFISPPEIVHEMDNADQRDYRQLTPSALYTSIKAMIKLLHELNKRIDAGVVLGGCVAILNMNSMPNTNILELPLHKPRILLPLPRTHSTLP